LAQLLHVDVRGLRLRCVENPRKGYDFRASTPPVRAERQNVHDCTKEADMGTKVREAMTGRPRSVTPDTPLSQVAAVMEADDIGAVPVVEGEQLRGMVTDRDIVVRAIAKGKDPNGMPVREIFSGEVITVGPDDDLSNALQLMAEHQVRRLPVVDEDNRLVGIVSQADVALEAKEKEVGQMVGDISRPPEGPRPV
jgi:CBS domain-containing protein